ncbi:lysophospholipase [Litoreibacter meonggei]|uniref:Lysophospholipase n=2 Tax=Rhodobacterales TaxID=204455 RepID=A0A497VIT0_9RHOB|nr:MULTISPECIES: alpha/beta hydrolase [Rhodobacterales]MDU9006755.1 alpha/beta hydrolase [Sedimentitalea todarodis]RLJ40548.1 lysophospholipase [Litoreibacter meonggei]
MEQAKFYGDIAEGPASGNAYWIETDDGVRVRVGTYDSEAEAKGTILLMLGRFGYVERYGRVAKTFAEKGYSTAIIDWRSQGLSDRMAPDPQAGHIVSFSDYQKDVAAFLKAAEELQLPKPYFLVGVSMGACIGFRAMLDGLPVAASAFISPMFGIKMSTIQRIAAWPLSWAFQKLGMGQKYVPGESGAIYVLETPFENNNLTHNNAMYDYWVKQAQAAPELQIGGPTMSWLHEALAECRRLSTVPSPSVPCITFCGELDQLVDNASIKRRMEKWPNAEFSMIRNAKHDVLTEIPEVGGDVMIQIFDFFARANSAAKR